MNTEVYGACISSTKLSIASPLSLFESNKTLVVLDTLEGVIRYTSNLHTAYHNKHEHGRIVQIPHKQVDKGA